MRREVPGSVCEALPEWGPEQRSEITERDQITFQPRPDAPFLGPIRALRHSGPAHDEVWATCLSTKCSVADRRDDSPSSSWCASHQRNLPLARRKRKPTPTTSARMVPAFFLNNPGSPVMR